MSGIKKAKTVSGVLAVLFTMPIWFYLLFQILYRVEASELMWFLYWGYVPIGMAIAIIKVITDQETK